MAVLERPPRGERLSTTGAVMAPGFRCSVISPYSKQNYVSHALTDTTSVLRFIEDNWTLGRLGDQSFDALAGSLDDLFNFTGKPHTAPVLLNPTTGAVVKR